MPYCYGILNFQKPVESVLNKVLSSWQKTVDVDEAKKELESLFPGVVAPDYDGYFRFPKKSLVCLMRATNTQLVIDCYSGSSGATFADFSLALRRISDISFFAVDSIGFEPQRRSWRHAIVRALIPGGIALFLAPPLIESLAPASLKLSFYVTVAIVITVLSTYLYRREQA